MGVSEDGTRLTLPPANVGAAETLKHTRHTIRILFNQHQLPSELLAIPPTDLQQQVAPDALEDGSYKLIFNLANTKPWQFLAIVEHQLIDVWLEEGLDLIGLANDRRWTTLQEVRLVLPRMFSKFLARYGQHKMLAPEGIANYGYWASALWHSLTESELERLPANSLLVEASAPHWIRQGPVTAASATTLQFLPFGAQLGILSSQADYRPSSLSAQVAAVDYAIPRAPAVARGGPTARGTARAG